MDEEDKTLLLVCDKADEECWRVLQKHFPAQTTRLARLDTLEQDLQHKLTRKRRLSTQYMMGPDVGPATQTLRIYVHHHLVRPAASSSSSSSSRASAIGSRSRGDGNGVGNGGGGGGGGGGRPSWALRIEGGVLQAAARAESGPCLSPHYYFTEFFDRVTVLGLQQETVVPRRGGGGAIGEGGGEEGDGIEWIRTPQTQDTDGLEFSQPLQGLAAEGATFKVRLVLHRRQYPIEEQQQGRRRLSPELTKVLQLRKEERQETVEATLLELIETRQLSLSLEPGWIACDDDLWKLFGRGLEEEERKEEGGEGGGPGSGKLHVSTLARRLEEHISPLEPLIIDYKVTPCQVLDDDNEDEGRDGGKEARWRECARVFDVEVETGPGRGELQTRLNALVGEDQQQWQQRQQQAQLQQQQQQQQEPQPRRVKARSRRKKGRKRRKGQAKKEGEEQNPTRGKEEDPEEEEEVGEEEQEEEEIGEKGGEEAMQILDRKIAYVGGLLVERAKRLLPVGRLDRDTAGLLLMRSIY